MVGDTYTGGIPEKRRSTLPGQVFILMNKPRKPNEICGTVQFSNDISNSDLIVELIGILKVFGETKEFDLIPRTRLSSAMSRISTINCLLSRGQKVDLGTYLAFEKYPFTLTLPPESLPPSFSDKRIAKIEYKLCLIMLKNGNSYKIFERPMLCQGQLTICNTVHPKELMREISVNGVRGNLVLERSQFLISEDILFTIRLYDGSRVGVQKITITLCRNTTLSVKDQQHTITDIMGLITLKEFPKQEIYKRAGKFGHWKTKSTSYERLQEPLLKIAYEIKIEVTTFDNETVSGSLALTLGTQIASPTTSWPQRSSSFLGEDLQVQMLPRSPRSSGCSRSSLAAFPPSYSQVPSRSTSMMSIEALPPRYEDLLFTFPEFETSTSIVPAPERST